MSANLEQVRFASSGYTSNPEFTTIADPASVAAFDAFLDVFNPALKGYGQYVICRGEGLTGPTIGVEAIGMKAQQPANASVDDPYQGNTYAPQPVFPPKDE